MKVAIVHDYLLEFGGAERVLLALAKMYPEAKIYTAFAKKNSRIVRELAGRQIIESGWAPLLKLGRMYSWARFLLPWVWRSLKITDCDVVITSCSGYIARGFWVSPETKVIAYCHTPPRFLYGYDTPTQADKKQWGKLYLWIFGPWLRYFDATSARRVDTWIANSQEVKGRIAKYYRQVAKVVYPPCKMNWVKRQKNDGDRHKSYWLIVSRLVGSKGLELAIDSVIEAKQRVIIVGVGDPQYVSQLRQRGGKYCEWRGYVADHEMQDLYAGAKGFLALARDEDFGMAVVEAMSAGVPVLALDGGGYRETVINELNGVRVPLESDPVKQRRMVAHEMKKWDEYVWSAKKIVNSVDKYSEEQFREGINEVVESL